MRVLRLQKNQKLLISSLLISLSTILIIASIYHYEITPTTIQRTLKLENFVNYSTNETHQVMMPLNQIGVGENEEKTNFDSDKFHLDDYHRGSDDVSIDSLYSFRTFLENEIFTPIMEQEQKIRKAVPLLSKKQHYADNVKRPHKAGPVKENWKDDPVYTKEFLLQYLRLNEEEIKNLKKFHSSIIKTLPTSFPEPINRFFQDSQGKGTNGYVYVGGTHFNFLILLSLKSLRASGSVLPVEIMIPKLNEFDVEMCNSIFPSFNARCIVMEDFIGKKMKKKITSYQMKSIALLISSFENTMLLDGDNMVLENPDVLFFSDPFKSHGLVLWPDLWRRSTSPFYYKIAGIEVDEYKKIRNSYWHNFFKLEKPMPQDGDQGYGKDWLYSYHDFLGTIPETSSESGQILINKSKHAQTLFLTIYYNYYGFDYYYPLLTQNSHGEGDKETYIAAAHALGEPYYQVQEFPVDFHTDHERVKQGRSREIHAVGQYNPVQDYKQAIDPKAFPRLSLGDFEYSNKNSHWEYKIWPTSRLMFLHCNGPKLYTWELIANHFKSKSGKRRRLYPGLTRALLESHEDFEMEIIDHMRWYFCQHDKMKIKGLAPSLDFQEICKELGEQRNYLIHNRY